jgi:hypothetical protein
VANIIGKMVLGGAFAATLAAAAPAFAQTVDSQFSGAPVYIDSYNAILSAIMPLSAQTVEFTGPLVYLDGYNAVLAAAVLSPTRIGAMDDPYTSYAFEPGHPRLWEGSFPK